jgi:hypothetical protein
MSWVILISFSGVLFFIKDVFLNKALLAVSVKKFIRYLKQEIQTIVYEGVKCIS